MIFWRGFAGVKAGNWLRQKIHDYMDEKLEMYSGQEGIYKDWQLPEIEFMTKKELSDFQEMVSLGANLIIANANPCSQVMRAFQKSELKEAIVEDEDMIDIDEDEVEEFEGELSIEPRRERVGLTSAL